MTRVARIDHRTESNVCDDLPLMISSLASKRNRRFARSTWFSRRSACLGIRSLIRRLRLCDFDDDEENGINFVFDDGRDFDQKVLRYQRVTLFKANIFLFAFVGINSCRFRDEYSCFYLGFSLTE